MLFVFVLGLLFVYGSIRNQLGEVHNIECIVKKKKKINERQHEHAEHIFCLPIRYLFVLTLFTFQSLSPVHRKQFQLTFPTISISSLSTREPIGNGTVIVQIVQLCIYHDMFFRVYCQFTIPYQTNSRKRFIKNLTSCFVSKQPQKAIFNHSKTMNLYICVISFYLTCPIFLNIGIPHNFGKR